MCHLSFAFLFSSSFLLFFWLLSFSSSSRLYYLSLLFLSLPLPSLLPLPRFSFLLIFFSIFSVSFTHLSSHLCLTSRARYNFILFFLSFSSCLSSVTFLFSSCPLHPSTLPFNCFLSPHLLPSSPFILLASSAPLPPPFSLLFSLPLPFLTF